MKENELQHHGILGQKWGVRRFQNKDGTLTSAGRKRYDGDGQDSLPKMPKGAVYSKNETKKVSEMSDEELRKRLNRLQLERQYDEETVKRGRKNVDKIIAVGTTVATVTTLATTIVGNIDKIASVVDKVVTAASSKK